MRSLFSFIILFILTQFVTIRKAEAGSKSKNYFTLKIYHFASPAQEAAIDSFLKYKYIPFLRGENLNNIGVFKPIDNDTSKDKKIYVFIPFKSLKQWEKYEKESIEITSTGDAGYVNAAHTKPAYIRYETILLKAFPLMPALRPSKLTSSKTERVYELRSYEGPGEKSFRQKVKMFNEGGEIALFSKLGFNAVFYSEVVFGSRMPNLMYMTSFENMKSRDEHWNAFRNDPDWKTLAAIKEYQNSVSHIDITFLRSMEYSDL